MKTNNASSTRIIAMGVILFSTIPNVSAGVPGESVVVAQAINAQTMMQKAEYHLMRIEMVKSAKILYDNYVQSKIYYDTMIDASKHRGGLMGFYKDKFMDRVRSGALEEYDRLQQMKYASDETAVKKFVEGGEEAVIARLNKGSDAAIKEGEAELSKMVDAVNDLNRKGRLRDEQLVALSKEGSGSIDSKKMDSLQLQATLLQIEYLAAIDKSNRMDMSRQLDNFRLHIAREKENLAMARSFSRKSVAQNRGQGKSGPLSESQIYGVLKEIP